MGYIYAVQLMPESKPERLKVGFTEDTDKRITSMKNTCPNATLLRCWKAERSKEKVVLSNMREMYINVGGEVFDVDNIKVCISNINKILLNKKGVKKPERKLIENKRVMKQIWKIIEKDKKLNVDKLLVCGTILGIWHHGMKDEGQSMEEAYNYLYDNLSFQVTLNLLLRGFHVDLTKEEKYWCLKHITKLISSMFYNKVYG